MLYAQQRRRARTQHGDADTLASALESGDRTWYCVPQRIGNSLLLCGRKQSRWPLHCMIGPDWWCTALLYVMIVVLPCCFIVFLSNTDHPIATTVVMVQLGVVLFFLSATACGDPGIVYGTYTQQQARELEEWRLRGGNDAALPPSAQHMAVMAHACGPTAAAPLNTPAGAAPPSAAAANGAPFAVKPQLPYPTHTPVMAQAPATSTAAGAALAKRAAHPLSPSLGPGGLRPDSEAGDPRDGGQAGGVAAAARAATVSNGDAEAGERRRRSAEPLLLLSDVDGEEDGAQQQRSDAPPPPPPLLPGGAADGGAAAGQRAPGTAAAAPPLPPSPVAQLLGAAPATVPSPPSSEGGGAVGGGLTVCGQCGVLRGAAAVHCGACGVCYNDMDHHCPWMSKVSADAAAAPAAATAAAAARARARVEICVAKKTLWSFYAFLVALATMVPFMAACLLVPPFLAML
ncbi:hypothetical protein JKP88DRAFT_351329 [Tribonema minus]|uniref:Palmitoyltransferase n=1 Tax=Tribonema minus TaxID=303371 RepID=A0A836C7V4_9STRA|nr:hypothetical protein JKP88DRAFT_351329 [Tribonema minus]